MLRYRLTTVIAVLLLLLGACGGGNGEAANDTTTTTAETTTTTSGGTTVPDEERRAVSVYFLQGEELIVGESREPTTEGVAGEALRELLEGPNDFEQDVGLTSAIPSGTRLIGVDIDDGVARIDLSDEFESGGGSQSMQARVAQVVYTATQFAQVDRVRILIDGEEVDAIGGEGLVVEEPLAREDFEFGGDFGDASLVPPVLVEEPRLGEQVDSPVRIVGTANVFEATFQVEVVDGDGLIVAEQTVMATSGTGERGTFDAIVDFEADSSGLGAISPSCTPPATAHDKTYERSLCGSGDGRSRLVRTVSAERLAVARDHESRCRSGQGTMRPSRRLCSRPGGLGSFTVDTDSRYQAGILRFRGRLHHPRPPRRTGAGAGRRRFDGDALRGAPRHGGPVTAASGRARRMRGSGAPRAPARGGSAGRRGGGRGRR